MEDVDVFIDTNIFLYALDGGAKGAISQAWIRRLVQEERGFISFQIAAEVVSNLTKKFGRSPADAAIIIGSLDALQFISTDLMTVGDALRLMGEASLSYYDAALIAAARKGGCKYLLTEDLNNGQIIGGVTVYHPF